MADAKKAVGLVVTLLVLSLLAAVLLPTAIGAMTGDESVQTTQAVDETVTLQGDLDATVTAVTAGTSATYNITTDGDSATTTVNVGSEDTVTVGGTDVTINTTAATSTNATQTFTHSTTYGWGGSATALWLILPLILVLAVFLYVTYVALGTM